MPNANRIRRIREGKKKKRAIKMKKRKSIRDSKWINHFNKQIESVTQTIQRYEKMVANRPNDLRRCEWQAIIDSSKNRLTHISKRMEERMNINHEFTNR